MAEDFEPCADHKLVPADNYCTVQWSPDPNGGPVTQVHLLMSLNAINMPDTAMILRLKSRAACQDLIDALTKHRNEVWPSH